MQNPILRVARIHRALILICALFFVAGLFALNDLSLYNPDSTRYLVWAKSLAGFNGFRDYTSPEGEQFVIHAPLYALVLAPISLLFGGSIIAMKIWTLCFGMAGIILMNRWVKGMYGETAGVIAALLVATNSFFWLLSTEILSDVPFCALMILTFLLSDAIAKDEESAPASIGRLVLFGALLAACMLLRELGIALVLATAAFALWKKDFRRLALSLEIPGLLYLLWWFRNDFIIAKQELPALTNAKMFAKRYYSSDAEPFVKELIDRIGTNVTVYAHRIGETLFFPMYNDYVYDIVYRVRPSFAAMYAAVHAVGPAIVTITFVAAAAGIYRDLKNSRTFGLKALFLAFYLAILCCYPINDVRFLLPLLVFLVYFFSIGVSWGIDFLQQRKRVLFIPSFALLAVLCIPNLFWISQDISAVRSYHEFFADSSAGGKSSTAQVLEAGSVFAKPFRLAGDWIVQHSPPGIVMLSQMKDIAYWVGQRQVLNVNETISVEDFDQYLRDYNVTFLVVARFANGLREFEYQMDVSPRYSFDLVERIGALDIYHAIRHPKGWRNVAPPDTSTTFRRGLVYLQRRDYEKARSLFYDVLQVDTLNYAALFFTGVADEFAGLSAEAFREFSRFQTLPQAGMYLDASQVHETCVQARDQVDADPDPETRSRLLLQLAGAYWQQGFHTQARDLLAQIFRADSSQLAAYAYGIYFGIDDGDGASARAYLNAARSRFGKENVIQEYSSYFVIADSLRDGLDTSRRENQLLELGETLHELGLEQAAADMFLIVLEEFPSNRTAANLLDGIYISERRFAPAARILNLHLAADPADASVQNELLEVKRIIGG